MEMKDIDLTKCVNCRFRAKVDGKEIEGRIAVAGDYLQFFYNHGDIYSVLISYYREHGVDCFDVFEIVPRDPETYRDWQVGDSATVPNEKRNDSAYKEIIFRSGELVICKDGNGDISGGYTCGQLHRLGYRLALTDIENQIIEEKKKFEPKDGDVCFVKTAAGNCFIFIKRDHKSDEEIHSYACFDTNLWSLCSAKVSCVCDRQSIRELRPATDEEKQRLFDAMAKQGKRWNAEKKVVEDVPKPYEFKKGEPVLVRYDNGRWIIAVFEKIVDDPDCPYMAFDGEYGVEYEHCIPYNGRTMHLLGTTEDYKEE